MVRFVSLFAVGFLSLTGGGAVFFEAENFDSLGGWVTDQQFMDRMGSPFLLAHGIGRPVTDAVTKAAIPAGSWRLWVRTRDWVAPQGPGRFEVLANGAKLGEFGKGGDGSWCWWKGGAFESKGESVELRLHDLTGFEGRVDALVFLPEKVEPPKTFDRAWRASLLGFAPVPKVVGHYDFVVVGGGYAGMCAAVAAARLGVRTALVQDRPVFGGNGSSEVRIPPLGKCGDDRFPRNADLMKELAALVPKHQGEACGDRYLPKDSAFAGWLKAETNLVVYAPHRGVAARTEPDGRIASVVIRNVRTGEDVVLEGSFFADCTGDGTLAMQAGAETRWDAEDREKTGEELSPPKGQRRRAGGLGSTNQWYARDTKEKHDFPECPWALTITKDDEALVGAEVGKDWIHSGGWNWESGFYKDPVLEGEAIRDHNFRAIYGLWDYLKHRSPFSAKYANAEIYWLGFVMGKRDGHRVVGDHMLTANEIASGRVFADGVVNTTWYLDLHFPHPVVGRKFPGEEFRAYAYDDWGWKNLRDKNWVGWNTPIRDYPIPFRCFYSRDVQNLFMAGKTISGTYAALSSYRVENTTGMMGTVVGRAAALCVKARCTPRVLGRDKLEVLLATLAEPERALDMRRLEDSSAQFGTNCSTVGNASASGTEVPFMIQRYRAEQNIELGVWEDTVAEFKKHPGCVNDVWFSTGVGAPPLAWHEEHVKRLVKASEDLRKLGISPSLEFQSTIGHGDPVVRSRKADISGKTWTGWTLDNGAETKSCACPRQPAFLEYVRKMSEIYARMKPVWLWLDDDFRIFWHTTDPPQHSGPGCYCQTCLAAFAEFDGTTRTREELVAALKSDRVLYERWTAFQYQALADVAAIIAETVHKLSPETRFGFQHGGGVRDYQMKVYNALWAKGGKRPVGSRPGGGAYTDHHPFDVVDKIFEMGRQMDVLQMPNERIALVCPEIENCPRNFNTKTARGAIAESLMALGAGMNSLSYFLVDPTDEVQSWYGDTYYKPLAATAPRLKRFAELCAGTRPGGLKLPRKPSSAILGAIGIPMTTAPAWECATLLEAGMVQDMCDQDLENVLMDAVVTDEAAARALKERGLLKTAEVGLHERHNARIQILPDGAFNAAWGLSSSRILELAEAADVAALGRMPVLPEQACQLVIQPRVTAAGALKAVAVVNAMIDVSNPVRLHLRGIPADCKFATWTPLTGSFGLDEVKLPVDWTAEGGEPRVTLPKLDAWACGYLSF